MAGIFAGFHTVASAGTAEPLATGTTPVFADYLVFFPRVVSGTQNTGEIRIGGKPPSGNAIPSGTGMRLSPGDAGVAWPLRGYDLRSIYVDCDTSGDGVQYIYAET
jgi:hypothetical protein